MNPDHLLDNLPAKIHAQPLAAVIEYYGACLPQNQRALAFLQRQALSPDAGLRVGFADRTLGKQLPTNYVKEGRRVRALLREVGVLKANGREVFRGHVTVPLTNTTGEVTGIYGLRIDPSQGEKETTLGSGLFNAAALQSFNEIILCQRALDAWAFCGAGYCNTIAAEGSELSPEIFAKVNRILLVGDFDHDLFAGKELLRIGFPDELGAHRHAMKSSAVPDALGKRIRAASWISGAAKSQIAMNQSNDQPASKSLATEDSESTETEPSVSPVPCINDELTVERSETEVTITIENRRWRIRGLDRNPTIGVLKVNVIVLNDRNDRFHVDTLDLCHARSRRVFLKECGEEIAVSESELRSDLGRITLKLDQLQHQQRQEGKSEAPKVKMTDAERSEAMGLLQDPHLLDRILDDFDACGIVGERTGKLIGYLAATSRLLPKPLGVIIQSSSAAGKTSLMNAVLSLMPGESQFVCSAMTSQSLYYAGNVDLRHKILSIAEEEGARNASYALKLLQSEGRLSIVTTGKESGTGRTIVQRYDVEGPVATLMTTTASDVDPELMNRCFVIGVDEEADQTAAIQARQRLAHTIDAQLAADEADRRRAIHHHAQRLLEPLRVDNPYAGQLRFPCGRVRDRRDNQAYMTLIDAIALLHQHQRERKSKTTRGKTVQYIEVTRSDIALANMIVSALMGSSIDDLPTQTRRLLMQIFQYVDAMTEKHDLPIEEVRFTRRQLRESLGWGQTQLKHHLDRLAQYEYVHVHSGPGRTLQYELRFDGRGREGEPTLYGLTDPSTLIEPTPRQSSGVSGVSSGQSRV